MDYIYNEKGEVQNYVNTYNKYHRPANVWLSVKIWNEVSKGYQMKWT
jgi:hypothetical protein